MMATVVKIGKLGTAWVELPDGGIHVLHRMTLAERYQVGQVIRVRWDVPLGAYVATR